MTWKDVIQTPSRRVLRQFGVTGAVMAIGVGACFRGGGMGWGWFALGAGLLMFAAWFPRALRWPFLGAMLLAFPVGFVVSRVVLVLLYFGVFWPLGVVLRWRGFDPLGLRKGRAGGSYWVEKRTPVDPATYLRQF